MATATWSATVQLMPTVPTDPELSVPVMVTE